MQPARRTPQFCATALITGIVVLLTACGGGDAPNRQPQITGASLQTDEDVVLTQPIAASDSDGDTLTFTKVGDPQHGTLSVAAGGTITYTPTSNYNGPDTFQLQVSDARGGQASAAFTVTVRPVNDPPTIIITLPTATLDEDTLLASRVDGRDADFDPLTYALVQPPAHGTVTLQADGSFVYEPAKDFNGTDTFKASVTDSANAVGTGDVPIIVRPLEDGAIAHDDELRVGAGVQTLDLLANDVDPDGDPMSVTILTQPRGGTVTVSNSNVVTFTPDNAFSGPTTDFTYAVRDPLGFGSSATVKLVAGNFSGVVFVADESVLGTRELFLYDGLRTRKLSAPLATGGSVLKFAFAADAHHLAYVVNYSAFDELFLVDLDQPGSARRIYTGGVNGAFPGMFVALNRDASFAMITDTIQGVTSFRLVRTADGAVLPVTTSSDAVRPSEFGGFNPVTEEFYFRGTVRNLATQFDNFSTLFAGTTSAPALVQIGPTYPLDPTGAGAGMNIRVSPDGKRVVHASVTFFPFTGDLLVNNRETHTETYVYRKFGNNEFSAPLEYDVSRDGALACLRINTGTSSSSGPGQIWYANTTMPGSATVLTPLADTNFGCRWGADGKTIVYFSAPTPGRQELYVANIDHPGVVQRLREPLTGTEEFDYFDLAQKTNTAVVGVRPSGSVIPDYYRVNLDSPGQSTTFALGTFLTGSTTLTLDPWGGTLIYTKTDTPLGGPGSIGQLRLMSSRIPEYDILISRPDTVAGVGQFAFVPAP
ncbi:MAG TPA: Ig-like domain-containing protein [Gemmatimonadaceae bacterium]|nr:Ig-like domain-containing protein [Gemmatimonadaceae bacterium]